MTLKYYAVKTGRTTGIFEQWQECQQAITGYSGAEYKAFASKEEAEAYLFGKDIWKDKINEAQSNGYLVAFTDGSFDKKLHRYSFGVLIIASEGKEFTLCGFGSNEKYISSQNIIGEILGVLNAMDWAVSNGYNKLKIYHDYEGLAKWISGEWEVKSVVAKMYRAIYDMKYSDLLDVTFEKVKGHSNNIYNDRVDDLAHSALYEQKRVAIKGDNWFCISYFEHEDLETLLKLVTEVENNIKITVEDFSTRMLYRLNLNDENLTLTYYKSGKHKILVQGQPSLLFQIVLSLLNELMNNVIVEEVLSSAYRKTIDKNKVKQTYDAILPSLPNDYPQNCIKLIKQAIVNLQYYVDAEDYAQYSFPALRVLEGHIKYLILSAGGAVGVFNYFNKDANDSYVFVGRLSDENKRIQISKCYSYYKKHRDTIFHFGDLIGDTDTTRMITSKDEANEIINNCINLICEI